MQLTGPAFWFCMAPSRLQPARQLIRSVRPLLKEWHVRVIHSEGCMKRLMISMLFSMLLFPVACNRSGNTGQQPEPNPRETAFSSGNRSLIGEFEGRAPFYRDGDLSVYMPLSGYPGKPFGLAAVLITRLAPISTTLHEDGVSGASDHLVICPAQFDSKGRRSRFKYTVNIDERGEIFRGKPALEAFAAGQINAQNPPIPGQKEKIDDAVEKFTRFKPEVGRVFLLDLAADPPSVTQVQIALEDVLARPGLDPTLDEMKAGVEKLAAKDKAVRDFLDRTESDFLARTKKK
jgi:hypothetical protein